MAISLAKGGNVSLTKQAAEAGTAELTALTVGLGWDARTTTGTEFDLDASAIAVKADGKVFTDKHFVFFNNLKSPEGAKKAKAIFAKAREFYHPIAVESVSKLLGVAKTP